MSASVRDDAEDHVCTYIFVYVFICMYRCVRTHYACMYDVVASIN